MFSRHWACVDSRFGGDVCLVSTMFFCNLGFVILSLDSSFIMPMLLKLCITPEHDDSVPAKYSDLQSFLVLCCKDL